MEGDHVDCKLYIEFLQGVLVVVLLEEVALDALEEEVDVEVLHEPAVVELADVGVLLLEERHAALAAHHP